MDKITRKILLTPGPATTTEKTKLAQVVPDICPREKEFGFLMNSIAEDLVSIVADTNEYVAVLFGGSGTAVVESILSSVVSENDCLLIINNGAYGERMCQIAGVHGLQYMEYTSSQVKPLDMSNIEAYIEQNKNTLSHLAVVHHETTTGLLNDIEQLGVLCKKFGLILIVDAISSYAAIPIDMKKMNIAFLASTSNKNLQGMPGVGFVIAAKSQLAGLQNRKKRSFYLDLYSQYSFFSEYQQTRFTPPVQTMYALRNAINETLNEGLSGRYERYSHSWKTLVDGLDSMGLKTVVPRDNQSKLITTIVEPEDPNFNFDEMHDYFIAHGITIYPGKLSGRNTFRIGCIGDIDYGDIQKFVDLLGRYFEANSICIK